MIAALAFFGNVKRIVLKIFRIRKFEIESNLIIDKLFSDHFQLSTFKGSLFKISDMQGNTFYLRKNTSDLLAFNQVILEHEYKTLVDLAVEYGVKEKINIVDAGANVGFSTRYLAGAFKDAAICSVEPSEPNIYILKLNTEEIKSCATILHAALWCSDGKVILRNDFRDKLEWSTRVSKAAPNQTAATEALSLAAIKTQAEFDNIDILKMDVEGTEGILFESEEFLIELKKIKLLAMEIHEENADKIFIINKLQELGFRLKYHGETLFGVNLLAVERK